MRLRVADRAGPAASGRPRYEVKKSKALFAIAGHSGALARALSASPGWLARALGAAGASLWIAARVSPFWTGTRGTPRAAFVRAQARRSLRRTEG